MSTTSDSTIRLAGRFNQAEKQWVVRQQNRIPHQADGSSHRENQYGYGATLMDALDDIVTNTSRHASKLLCKVMLPNGHIHTVKLDV
jgi:hypothetical protein